MWNERGSSLSRRQALSASSGPTGSPFIATLLVSNRSTASRVSRQVPTVVSGCSAHQAFATSCAACPWTSSGNRTLASAIQVIQVRDIFLFEDLPKLAVGANRNRVTRRQLYRRLSHSLPRRRGLRGQQTTERLGHQVTKRGTALHSRDLGPLHQVIWQI